MPAVSAGTVSLPVHPDTNGFGKKLSAGVMGESGLIGGLGKHLGGLIVGGLAVAGIGASIGSIVSKGLEEVKGNSATLAQLTAGVKSTGGAAGVTTTQMLGLAKSIEEYSGQSHGSIGAAEKLLLTFTNIKNVGPDKIFDQATKAAADMAAKFGGDAAGQSILLGKALNDPVRGITALTRVGVAFSTSQRAQIKAMQDSGNTMGAQKVILAELTKEFGGAAEAVGNSLPGQIEKSKRAFEAFSGAAVGVLVPILVPAISLVTKGLNAITPVVDKISAAFGEKVTPVLGRVGAAAKGLFDLFARGNFTGGLGKALGIEEDSPIVGTILSIRDGVIGAFGKIMEVGRPIFDAMKTAFKQLLPVFAPLIPQIVQLATSLSPVRLIFEAIAPVLPGLVGMLGNLASMVAGALGSALQVILPVLTQVAGTLVGQLAAAAQMLVPVIGSLVAQLGPVLGGVLQTLAPLFASLLPVIAQVVSMVAGQLIKIVMMLIPVVVQLVGVIGPLLGQVLAAVAPLLGTLAKLIGAVLAAVLPLIQPIIGLVLAFVPLLAPLIQMVGVLLPPLIDLLTFLLTPILAVVKLIGTFLTPVITVLANIIVWVVGTVIKGFVGAFGWVIDIVVKVGGVIGKVFGAVGGIIRGAFNGVVDFVRGIFNTIIGVVNHIIDGINTATGLAGAIGIHIGKIPHLPRLAESGTVLPRPGGTLALIAEGGKAESVVDTGKLNKLLDAATNSAGKGGTFVYNNYGPTGFTAEQDLWHAMDMRKALV